ncbi:hypothetical protein AB8615_05590 [Litorimonas sp. RW-G-Af-16]|uniref:hypothetical protein n=1 Tax=Litorimonas sp. RW-G-Af-16 TaxID=3241168 RepID=UPI003AAE2262
MDLRRIGLDVQLAAFDGKKLNSIPREAPGAVLCFFTDYIEKTKGVCDVLRQHFAPKTPPIIGALSRPSGIPTDHFGSIIYAPMHSSQVANRVDSMIRLGEMEVEITRRIETLRENFGQDVDLSSEDLDRPFRILFIGKATPGFMVIINALQSKNVEVVAAFTSFSAFDYLHDRQFDAVVMNALEQPEPALTISETMRRNAKLYHVPTLFLIKPDEFEFSDAAYERGARDLVSIDADLEEISGRILELANYHRIHEQLKISFGALGGKDCVDPETGVFNADFLAAHMARVVADCRLKDQNLTMLAVRPIPNATVPIDAAYANAGIAKVGGMLKSLVRMQDIIARVDEDTFLLAFTGATQGIVEGILGRMTSLIDCAAFETGNKTTPSFTFKLDAAVVEDDGMTNSDFLIGRAISKIDGQPEHFEPQSATA